MSGKWVFLHVAYEASTHLEKASNMIHRKRKLGIGTSVFFCVCFHQFTSSSFFFSQALDSNQAHDSVLRASYWVKWKSKTIQNHYDFMFTNNLAVGHGTDEGHVGHKMGRCSPTGHGTGLLQLSYLLILLSFILSPIYHLSDASNLIWAEP